MTEKNSNVDTTKKPRGFAALSPERRREISSRGGKAAHERGVAYQWTSETAKISGRKGGIAYREKVAREAAASTEKT